jgi:hypothetical protein
MSWSSWLAPLPPERCLERGKFPNEGALLCADASLGKAY